MEDNFAEDVFLKRDCWAGTGVGKWWLMSHMLLFGYVPSEKFANPWAGRYVLLLKNKTVLELVDF